MCHMEVESAVDAAAGEKEIKIRDLFGLRCQLRWINGAFLSWMENGGNGNPAA